MKILFLIVVTLHLVIGAAEGELQYGDIIAVPKSCGFTFKHYGIYLDKKRFKDQKDNDNIFHFTGFKRNAILGGCIFDKIDIQQYEKDNYLDKIKTYKDKVSTEEITRRIEEKYESCGTHPKTDIWEAFSNNCEHLANYIRYGEKISLQIGQNAAVLVRNPEKTKDEINQIKQQLTADEVLCDDACKKQGTQILKEDRYDDESCPNTKIV
ncbi:lecithin retinol acyltransferase-like [Poeciliopsis prolifica]|uniref:lecithin retinol acyltransferase-like n=1 Tax=Poeciliopsis prolifica TaxID=188132 RepID=UPI0024135CCA|nr:lecithin retinol acyltransferase-like [Poeciliopsis prolifica]